MKILQSTEKSIKSLASISGFEIFYFFNNCNLSNLNLENQDLTGLNFFGANLENSNLDGIVYDKGAFNGAKIPDRYSSLKDPYDFIISDILNRIFEYIYVFFRFREETLEASISHLGISYTELSKSSNINISTLRKARRGEVVSYETALGISKALITAKKFKLSSPENSLISDKSLKNIRLNLLMQPMINILEFNNNDGFKAVDSSKINFLNENMNIINFIYRNRDEVYNYKFTPESLCHIIVNNYPE